MTEKIIIDGVNVAGCMDYKEVEYKEMPICMNYYNHLPKPPKETEWQYCAGNKNCYYKQLKRLEIEIEKLKGVDGSVHPDSAYYKITRLEQENKELKEKAPMKLIAKNNKYRSALEEIKKECKCYSRSRYTQEYDRKYGGELHVNIIETINEVLNDK